MEKGSPFENLHGSPSNKTTGKAPKTNKEKKQKTLAESEESGGANVDIPQ
jgi:hypothetical protein